MNNTLEKSLTAAQHKCEYDENAKQLLSEKIILAYILKYSVSEVSTLSIEQIMNCIESIHVGHIPIEPGLTNMPVIIGNNTEDKIPYEGFITYDIRFFIKIPLTNEILKILIDVEAQKSFWPGYDIVTRGVFYGARMISSQLDREFKIPYYNNIKKVYSIWICMNANKKVENTITEVCMHQNNILGAVDHIGRYDLISVILVGLSKEISENTEEHTLNRLLEILFSKLPLEQKKQYLTFEYNIQITPEIERRINTMCNLSDAIEEWAIESGMAKGMAAGMEKGMEEGLEKGMEKGMEKGKFLKLIEIVRKKYLKGISAEACADFLEETPDTINLIYELLANNPLLTNEELYDKIPVLTNC